jgi:hypothetical protein
MFRRKSRGVSQNKYVVLSPYATAKGKAVPLQAWSGPEGSRKLRFPDFVTTAQEGGKPYAPAAFTPRKCDLPADL